MLGHKQGLESQPFRLGRDLGNGTSLLGVLEHQLQLLELAAAFGGGAKGLAAEPGEIVFG